MVLVVSSSKLNHLQQMSVIQLLIVFFGCRHTRKYLLIRCGTEYRRFLVVIALSVVLVLIAFHSHERASLRVDIDNRQVIILQLLLGWLFNVLFLVLLATFPIVDFLYLFLALHRLLFACHLMELLGLFVFDLSEYAGLVVDSVQFNLDVLECGQFLMLQIQMKRYQVAQEHYG